MNVLIIFFYIVTKDYKGGLHSYCSKNKIAPLEFETMPVGKGGGFVCSISVKKKVFGSLGKFKFCVLQFYVMYNTLPTPPKSTIMD